MKTQYHNTQEAGFTLIETLMAMAIFTIGILGLFGMQTAVIKQNLAANTITTGATWATNQVEQIIGLPYLHADLAVGITNCDDLGNWEWLDGNGIPRGGSSPSAHPQPPRPGLPLNRDGLSSNTIPEYRIYWNVAQDCTMIGIPDAAQPENEQKTKHIRVIVARQNDNGTAVEAAVFNYIKQNVRD